MTDITVQILESIRSDIAALDAKVERKFDDTNREVHRLALAVEHNGERLGSMVSVLRLAVRREDDLDERIRRLEAEVFRAG